MSSYQCVIFSSALPAVGDASSVNPKSVSKKKGGVDVSATEALSAATKTPKAAIDDVILG